MTRRVLLPVCVLVVAASSLPAQGPPEVRAPAAVQAPTAAPVTRHPEEGRPFVREYRPEELGGGGQNWAIVQDARGVIYVGSASGVLEFDGATWRLIEAPRLDTVRSLAIAEDGRIYAGGVGDIGVLEPDATGKLAWVSLVDRLPEDARRFGDVWRTFASREGIYFQSESQVMWWADGAMRVIRPRSRFHRASLVDGRLHLTMPETGLHVLEGDTFRPLPGTESLARENYPVLLRYDDRRLLVGTRFRGFFLYDGATLEPFATELDDWAKASSLYRGVEMPDGNFALGTQGGGLGIMDREGRRVAQVGRNEALPADAVYYIAPDREGALWVGTERGIARVEIPSPASYYDQSDGFRGAFNMVRHEGRLYLASGAGLSYLEPASRRLVPVTGIGNQCWWFETMTDSSGRRPAALPVACTDGLYEVRGTSAVPVLAPGDGSYRSAVLERSRVDPSRLWVGLFDGLGSLRWLDGRWIDEGRVEGIPDQIRSLVENPDGSLWAGTSSTGLLRVRFTGPTSPGLPRPPPEPVERFDARDGLPDGGIFVGRIAGDAVFFPWGAAGNHVVARFDPSARRFVRDDAFSSLPVDRLRGGFGIIEGRDGLVFANFGRGITIARKGADGSWTMERGPFARFGENPSSPVLTDPDGVAWFGTGGRLIRLDLRRAGASPVPFQPLIRGVTAGQDTVLFAGAGTLPAPRLPAASNSVRIEYAAPTFLDETATEYQTRLDGLDRDWSAWTRETRRDYTNLGFGDYRFRVRARNVVGLTSDEASYALTILPPWYRTWSAYAGYLALLALGVYGVDRFQRRRLIGKERERARFNEARLRAEAAEALARSESEGKKNVELLSEIGREITASLDIDTIFGRLYERVNALADAEVFGVGTYHPERRQIEYRLAFERGRRYEPYTRDTTDPDQLPVWCIEHRQPVFINDLREEYRHYITRLEDESRRLEDGSMSEEPQSVIYMPLVAKERVLGIITIQSFRKHAYTEHHLNVMRSLASYTAIALDNADAYRQLNEHEREIRRLLEEAQLARAAAEEADAAKSAFLSTVSHELRTPLTSVLGFAKIIKKRLEERIFPLVPTGDRKVAQTVQQVAQNLEVVVSEGERLTKLIDDVLDLAKIEAGKLEWHMEPVAIGEVIERAMAATASLFEHKGLRAQVEVGPGLPLVNGDRDRLIQVVINLLSNAVKFTESGSVTCRAERRDGEIVVSVADTGVGIAPADQPKVFERFKQVGDTLTDKPKGTGLGLPICREIVEHHQGRIWVESEPGRGSTFAFSLPALGVEGREADRPVELSALIRQLRTQVEVATARTEGRVPSILVVDDDPNIRELLTQEFAEAGYDVRVAEHGRQALAEVRRQRPDLIVLDVMMPEMNGFDVAAVLKNDPLTSQIPIVILSVVSDRERGVRIGVDRYLSKPIDTELLFREVGTLLDQKTSRKRVLVVDEDASTVKTLSDVLAARGYSVTEANGHDLVEKAVSLQPDVILLNAVSSARTDAVRLLRFERGMENVLFLVYQ